MADLKDTEGTALDTGSAGKKFETILMKGLKLAGLDFESNSKTGAVWDIHPKGEGWVRLVSNKDVNIKLANTKWVFGSVEFGKLINWDEPVENKEKVVKKIKRYLNKSGVSKVVFLKPKSTDVQNKIIDLVSKKDKDGLVGIFVKKNFTLVQLGRSYDVRIITKRGMIGSIAIDKGGSVFARSERPRKVGGSNSFVAFRTPKAHMSKTKRKIKEEIMTASDVIRLFEKPSFDHGKLYYFGDGDPTKLANDWVEELYRIAAPEVGKKAVEWAQEQMQKFYGKPGSKMLSYVQKQMKSFVGF